MNVMGLYYCLKAKLKPRLRVPSPLAGSGFFNLNTFVMEEWKLCKSNRNYRVSNKGNIQTRYKTIRNSKGMFETIVDRSWHDVNQFEHSAGYYSFNMRINGKSKMVFSHRVVALNFIRKEDPDLIVNHKNGKKRDNRVENLEWVTYSENHRHAFRTGIRKISKEQKEAVSLAIRGENNHCSKLTAPDITLIRKMFEVGMSNNEISEHFDVTRASIYGVTSGKTWKHI